ncbi:MAG: dephospho-CoA kinase [Saprospiraceae bacterium]|nr:dephospho-CoA kinase [Candidatus Vicinibacter proximus]MBL7823787.1 dephospho-CoA kinase [Saprospiraceae bacterium]HRG32956.1 dephospho-CoA kinase [Saprospiraceae bacterium]
MIIVGLTGGIGSGKSTVADIFKTLGIPCYNSDIQARVLMEQERSLIENIKALLGEEAYTEDGRLNRKFIASKVFTDNTLLLKLNHLVHPMVHQDFNHWMTLQNSPYVIKESALLPATLSSQPVDFVVLVEAPTNLRIQRVMDRDKLTESEVKSRLKNQSSSKIYKNCADFIVLNDGKKPCIPQVLKIHERLLKFVLHKKN